MARLDRALPAILSEDGRISVADIIRRIGLSKSPTQACVKRLEAEGIITGYRALLDPIRLELDQVAFVEVRLTDTREKALAEFNAAVRKVAEIEQAHMMASNFEYFLNIRTGSMSRIPLGSGQKNLGITCESAQLICLDLDSQ